MGDVEHEVAAYVAGIEAASRPLFDRVDGLIRESFPEASVRLAYQMPTYDVGAHSLHVAAWKHGVSLYGWDEARDGGFAARHPELSSGKGTLRLTHDAASSITDDELTAVIRGALGP